MNEKFLSRLSVCLPFASLALTLAAFCSGAPAKLVRYRAAQSILAESDFRDEPAMYPLSPNAFAWRDLNALSVRATIALK